jgi:hypothetical protein
VVVYIYIWGRLGLTHTLSNTLSLSLVSEPPPSLIAICIRRCIEIDPTRSNPTLPNPNPTQAKQPDRARGNAAAAAAAAVVA